MRLRERKVNLLRFLLLSLLFSCFAYAEPALQNRELNTTELQALKEAKAAADLERKNQQLHAKLLETRKKLNTGSIWLESYNSYMTYLDVSKDLEMLQKKIQQLSKRGKSIEDKDEIASFLAKEKILTDQVELLKGQGETPFASLLKPEELSELPTITNPFEIFRGISYVKHLDELYEGYIKRQDELQELVDVLREQDRIYNELIAIEAMGEGDHIRYLAAKRQLDKFETALDTVTATAEVYEQRIDSIELRVNKEIEKQLFELINIGVIILVLFIIFFLLKMVVKKYITDNERFYMANKIITFVNVTLVIFVLLFAYIDNAGYIVTVLGFASAGIAIAMKDWFMSMLGWLVIVFGGSIHVGDRIRFVKDGMEYVGDVLDISLLRITVYEDVTLSTYMVNRRAGRVVFVPNNYIFTSMIANYSHSSLKTVWDGIDITITFDSNHKKAMHIAKEISRKYSKGYTDITRKQLNKLRNKYSLKNTNVEPRIFSFIEPNGIRVSAWYLTNAYATLTLRSVISTDIVDAYNKEEDISIAYPTQQLYLTPSQPKEPPFETREI